MSRQDGFFTLGGDSILVISAVAKIRAAGLEVAVLDFFLQPNLAALAAAARPVAAPARRPGSPRHQQPEAPQSRSISPKRI